MIPDEKLAFPRQEILDLYDGHPVREERILKRLEREHQDLKGLTEADLAGVGAQPGASDQNHVGGIDALDRLARTCDVGPRDRVLDVGCGLGGTARRWAETYGARVLGVDLSPRRIHQAQCLTQLVGLEDRVRFQAGDVLEMELPENHFDLVLCQATASHIRAKDELFEILARCLVPGGRLALEEPAARTRDDLGHREVRKLADLWKVALESLDGWRGLLTEAGFEILLEEDLSDDFVAHQEAMLRAVRADRVHPPEREVRTWERALEQARAERVAYMRWVAQAPSS